MEPCPYRQGEPWAITGTGAPTGPPQWSPALIGRERRLLVQDLVVQPHRRNGALPLSAGRADSGRSSSRVWLRAAMEPCPYRQGEATDRYGNLVPDWSPQWSPALIGRESIDHLFDGTADYLPQWSPALIGRERVERERDVAGRGVAAMEPCPYRQGELLGSCRCVAG